jgi:ribosomal protein L37AE/L43A
MAMRRGSSFYRDEMARMFDQFKPGFIVAPTFIGSSNDALRGVVTAVNRVENKVYVAWNGGAVSQHDPDDVMIVSSPVHFTNAPVVREEAVEEGLTPTEEAKQEQQAELMTRRAHIGRRMAFHQEKMQGDPSTHGLDTPVSGGTNVMQNLVKDLRTEASQVSGNGTGRRMAVYHAQRGRFYKRNRAEAESDGANCPKCGDPMQIEPYTKSEKMWRCPECGWKIPTSRVLA